MYLCVFDKESYSFSQKLFNDIQEFIDDEYVDEHDEDYYDELCGAPEEEPLMLCKCCEALPPMEADEAEQPNIDGLSLKDYIEQMDKSFQEMLFDLIDESGMTDVECYKKANVDKRTFSKIKSNKDYRPSKQTVIAFAISLQLDNGIKPVKIEGSNAYPYNFNRLMELLEIESWEDEEEADDEGQD